MPTYQYLCTECGGQLEAVQKFTDEPLTVHDDCGGKLRKVFSPVGIVFKGSGFYRTDSRDKSSSSSTTSSSSSSSSSTSESSTTDTPKTDTKKEAPKTETAKPAASSSSAAKVA